MFSISKKGDFGGWEAELDKINKIRLRPLFKLLIYWGYTISFTTVI